MEEKTLYIVELRDFENQGLVKTSRIVWATHPQEAREKVFDQLELNGIECYSYDLFAHEVIE